MADPYLEFLRCPDRRHYTRFVTAYFDPMIRVASRVMSQPELAGDAVQDAFLRLAESKTRPERLRKPRVYVLKTVLNVARNHLQRERRRALHEKNAGKERARAQPGPVEDLLVRESVRRIYEAIDRLPREYRVAIHLRVVEGLSYREIAEVTGSTLEAVASRIHRARERLKKSLGGIAFAVAWAKLRGARAAGWLPRVGQGAKDAVCLHYARDLMLLCADPGGHSRDGLASGWTGQGRQALGIAAVAFLSLGLQSDTSMFSREDLVASRRSAVESEQLRDTPHAAIERSPGVSHPGSGERKGGDDMRSRKRLPAMLTATLGLAALSTLGHGEPGDLVAVIPSHIPGPVDITYDPKEDVYWVVSAAEPRLFRHSSDLTNIGEVVDSVPLPVEAPPLVYVVGVAYNSIEDTILISLARPPSVLEVKKDGSPTGRTFTVPVPEELGFSHAGGMAFNPQGDNEQGSVYVVLRPRSVIQELSLDGRLIRSFPEIDELRQHFGSESSVSLTDIDLIYDGQTHTGFYVMASSTEPRRLSLLRLDLDGHLTGVAIPIDQTTDLPDGLLQCLFPHPETGEEIGAFLCVQSTGSRFLVLEGGEPEFQPIFDFQCQRSGANVSLTWNALQAYGVIEVRSGCEVLATLEGRARSWDTTLEVDGLYELTVRGITGERSTETEPCEILQGPGRILNVSEAVDGFRGEDMTADDRGSLIVASGSELLFFDLDLALLQRTAVSEFFLAEGEDIGGVAHDGKGETLLLYNDDQHTIGRVDYSGLLLHSFPARLPGLPDGPAEPGGCCWVRGMAFHPGGNGGAGSLLVAETTGDAIHELDLAGNPLREYPHPFQTLDVPVKPPFEMAGIDLAGGRGVNEVYLSGRFRGPRGRVFRADLEAGKILAGPEIPLVIPTKVYGLEYVFDDGKPRLYVLGRRSVYELQPSSDASDPPALLFGRQVGLVDEVELTYLNNGPYDRIDVFRDCEKLGEIDGAASAYTDRVVEPAVHEYAVRGVRDGIPTAFARTRLQVGPGAILERASSTGSLMYPDQIARNPLDGSIFVVADRKRTIYRFDEHLELKESREIAAPASFVVKSLAVRVTPGDVPLLCLLLSEGNQYSLVTETLEGEIDSAVNLSPPRNRFGNSKPTGLAWDSDSGSFYFLELNTSQICRMAPDGEILETLEHPFTAHESGYCLTGCCCLLPGRGSLLLGVGATTPCVSRKAVELKLDGTLTGFEIPLETPGITITDFETSGGELVAVSIVWPWEFLRLKGLGEESPPPALFIRGDSNGDLVLNITDAVYLLSHLFRGGQASECGDAGDADDNGKLNITDAIVVLNHLFQGGPMPPEPFPERGLDPTPDSLLCVEP